MLKTLLSCLLLLSFSAPASAAKAQKHLPPAKKIAPPGVDSADFAEEPITALDKELIKGRSSALDLREDLKLSANGKEAEMENLPLAPASEDSSSEN